jgi:prolipoprotein diacylglyceryltransferase
MYMIFYGGGRFFLEFLKLDAPAFGSGPTIAQLVSIAASAVGLAFLVIRHRLSPETSSAEPTG